MKKGLLTTAVALMLMLTSCSGNTDSSESSSTGGDSSSEDSSQITDEISATITNEDALKAEWQVGDAPRSVDITTDPAINQQAEILAGNLKLTTSNDKVVGLAGGLGITAVGEGEATVSVVYKEVAVASVTLTVKAKESAITRYGTTHAGTLEDPLSNEDAILVGKKALTDGVEATSDSYYIKGEVDYFYHCVGERDDNVVSWFLKPASEGGEQFEAYKILKEDGSSVSDAEVFPGAIVTFKGQITKYKDQIETVSGTYVSTEGTAPEIKTHEVSVAEAITVGKALKDGNSTYDKYTLTAYVISAAGNNVYLADTKDETDTSKQFLFLTTYYKGENKDRLLPGAKIKTTIRIKNYHGTVEQSVVYDLQILEEGHEIKTIDATVSEALTVVKDLTVSYDTTVYSPDKYAVTGYVCKVGEWSTKYNNWDFYIAESKDETDTANMLQIYRNGNKDCVALGDKIKVTDFLAVYQKNETSSPKYQFKQGATVEVIEKADNGDVPTPTNAVEITSAKLGLTNKYVDNTTGVNVDGITIGWTQVSDYGDGIQMRYNNNVQSAFYNLVSTSKVIKSITLNLNAAKYTQYAAAPIEVTFGNTASLKDEATPTETITPVKDTNTYTINATEGATFFKVSKSAASYTLYFTSVVITFVE